MKARPTQSRKGVKGQRPLWGLGQRPNCSASDQSQGSRQQRCRQRSVPAPNFARPQTRPQAALPPRFREEPIMFTCAICLRFGAFSLWNSIKKHGRMRGKTARSPVLYYFQIHLHHLLAPFSFWRPVVPLSVALLRCVPLPLARKKKSLRILAHSHLEIVLIIAHCRNQGHSG